MPSLKPSPKSLSSRLPILISLVFFVTLSCRNIEVDSSISAELERLPSQLDFNIHVKPILSDKCFACHGPDQAKRKAGLRLDIAEDAYGELPETPGKNAIVPGKLGKSELIHRILSKDPETHMPPPEFKVELSNYEKAVLIQWVEDGATYKAHWAFQKPVNPKLPKVSNTSSVKNPIDLFILEKLAEQNLTHNTRADKELLLRRLSFDLTGLPPTEEEIDGFLQDHSTDAYEKQVDRLLASPHYGEKMAIDWMDLARYSDTHGYTVDFYRDVSPWRDWIIQSFNDNMPYDQFIHWQMAGDMMPNPTREQILATTFNRLHPQNLEDGIVDEEFRVEYVVDRTSVLGTGFLGLTVACARCHDHKYDPISQKNFYELYSFFNNINESGLIPRESSTPVPTLLLPDKVQQENIDFLGTVVAEQEESLAQSEKDEWNTANDWVSASSYQTIGSGKPKRGLIAHYPLDDDLLNVANRVQVGKMDREYSKGEKPTFIKGKKKQGLLMDGDAWLDLDEIGVFRRKDAFSIALWINIPDSTTEGVIFHKGKGTGLHAYRGYHVYLKDDKLELMLSHTAPDNAIIEQTIDKVPKNKWVHLLLSYDGSSKAEGLKLYVDGGEMETETIVDNLYKDIIFFDYEDVIYPEPIEPGLQIGARWRGVGIKGAKVDDIHVFDTDLSEFEVLQIAKPERIKSLVSKSPDLLTLEDLNLLKGFFLATKSPLLKQKKATLAQARAILYDSLENIQEIMVMKEMENPRRTYILDRGIYDAYGEEVFPNVPSHILPWPTNLPTNRLGLAKWLTQADHPLTARVAVNRYWQQYFGRGIVATTEDFGNQGKLPSHPELLDWLALEFIQSGWDIKALQKLIVMSATYQQGSRGTESLHTMDPDNILLARGPKLRLTSEMMRDNVLAASGLLNPKIGGESVRPYQPKGLWKMNSNTYVEDSGDNLYRRSLYTLWKRTVPNPTLSTFDQPERSECTVRRQKTNTPLQALVLLNDPTYVEAAKVLGETITKDGATPKSIARAYRKVTGLEINQEELQVLKDLQSYEYQVLQSKKGKNKGWLEAGAYRIDKTLDANMVAANAIVASVILNSDASITKR